MKRTAQAKVVAVVSDPAANRSMAVTHNCSSESVLEILAMNRGIQSMHLIRI